MNSLLLVLASATVAFVGIGGLVTWVAVRRAPDGIEDADGFHATSRVEHEPHSDHGTSVTPHFA